MVTMDGWQDLIKKNKTVVIIVLDYHTIILLQQKIITIYFCTTKKYYNIFLCICNEKVEIETLLKGHRISFSNPFEASSLLSRVYYDTMSLVSYS